MATFTGHADRRTQIRGLHQFVNGIRKSLLSVKCYLDFILMGLNRGSHRVRLGWVSNKKTRRLLLSNAILILAGLWQIVVPQFVQHSQIGKVHESRMLPFGRMFKVPKGADHKTLFQRYYKHGD